MWDLTVLLPAEIYKLSSDTLLPSNLITGRSDNSGRVVPSIITEFGNLEQKRRPSTPSRPPYAYAI